MPLRDLPPPARLLAWPALHGHAGDLPGVRVARPVTLLACAPALACCSDEVTVELPGTEDYLDAVETMLSSRTARELLTEPLRLISALVIWDELFRDQGVFAGRIYLAGDYSVDMLLRTSGFTPPADLRGLLDQLQNLELLYRFPVALKFRGRYGPERQCRVNGWGRLLHRMVVESGVNQDWIDLSRHRLEGHLRRYYDAYSLGIAAAERVDDQTVTQFWAHIHATQPIPVVI